jgi:hypothetical protein
VAITTHKKNQQPKPKKRPRLRLRLHARVARSTTATHRYLRHPVSVALAQLTKLCDEGVQLPARALHRTRASRGRSSGCTATAAAANHRLQRGIVKESEDVGNSALLLLAEPACCGVTPIFFDLWCAVCVLSFAYCVLRIAYCVGLCCGSLSCFELGGLWSQIRKQEINTLSLSLACAPFQMGTKRRCGCHARVHSQ